MSRTKLKAMLKKVTDDYGLDQPIVEPFSLDDVATLRATLSEQAARIAAAMEHEEKRVDLLASERRVNEDDIRTLVELKLQFAKLEHELKLINDKEPAYRDWIVRARKAKMEGLRISYNVAEGDWATLAYRLATQLYSGFEVVKEAPAKRKWTLTDKAILVFRVKSELLAGKQLKTALIDVQRIYASQYKKVARLPAVYHEAIKELDQLGINIEGSADPIRKLLGPTEIPFHLLRKEQEKQAELGKKEIETSGIDLASMPSINTWKH